MSVQTQIDRIEAAKEAIATAIAEKGVTVPSETRIDGMAGLIAAIESGGGLPTDVSALASGSVTPTEDVDYIEVTHNLGVAPNFIAWAMEEDTSASVLTNTATHGTTVIKSNKHSSSSSIVYSVHNLIGGYGSSSQAADTYNRVANNTYLTTTKARMTASTTYCLKAGKTYRWVCGVLDGIQ